MSTIPPQLPILKVEGISNPRIVAKGLNSDVVRIACSSMRKRRPGWIECRELGVWVSVRSASKRLGVTQRRVRNAVKQGAFASLFVQDLLIQQQLKSLTTPQECKQVIDYIASHRKRHSSITSLFKIIEKMRPKDAQLKTLFGRVKKALAPKALYDVKGQVFPEELFDMVMRAKPLAKFRQLSSHTKQVLDSERTELKIKAQRAISPYEFGEFLKKFPKLNKLDLSNCKWLTDEHLAQLPTTIKHLDLSGCIGLNSPLLHLTGMSQLESLNLSSCYPKKDQADQDMHYIQSLTNLKELKLSWIHSPLTFQGIRYFQFLTHLETLDLSGCGLVGQDIAVLSQLTALKSLNLSNNYIQDGLQVLQMLPQLEKVDLADNENLGYGIADLQGSNIKTLCCTNCQISNGVLQKIAQVHSLEILDIRFNANIDEKGIDYLGQLLHLHTLMIGGLELSKELLQKFNQFQSLRRLDLEWCILGVQKHHFDCLVELKQVKEFYFDQWTQLRLIRAFIKKRPDCTVYKDGKLICLGKDQ